MKNDTLPLIRNLTVPYALSLVIAISVVGLLFQATIYPIDELRRAFVSNDVVNVFIGLPILLGSIALACQRLSGNRIIE
jgi:hypothetical protein